MTQSAENMNLTLLADFLYVIKSAAGKYHITRFNQNGPVSVTLCGRKMQAFSYTESRSIPRNELCGQCFGQLLHVGYSHTWKDVCSLLFQERFKSLPIGARFFYYQREVQKIEPTLIKTAFPGYIGTDRNSNYKFVGSTEPDDYLFMEEGAIVIVRHGSNALASSSPPARSSPG